MNVKEQLCERNKRYHSYFTRGETRVLCLTGWCSFRRTVTEQVAQCFNLLCKLERFWNYCKWQRGRGKSCNRTNSKPYKYQRKRIAFLLVFLWFSCERFSSGPFHSRRAGNSFIAKRTLVSNEAKSFDPHTLERFIRIKCSVTCLKVTAGWAGVGHDACRQLSLV